MKLNFPTSSKQYKLNSVRVLGVIDKDDLDSFWRFLEQLDKEEREGVVLKDPEYRVEPLKYTTNVADISDIAHGMLFFGDEGRVRKSCGGQCDHIIWLLHIARYRQY